MRQIIFLIIFVFSINVVSGQNSKNLKTIDFRVAYDNANNDKFFEKEKIHTPPTFNNDIRNFEKFLKSQLTYSKKMLKKGVVGRMYIQLKIAANGEVLKEGTGVIKGITPLEINDKIQRLLVKSPPWEPAKRENNSVEAFVFLIVDFTSN